MTTQEIVNALKEIQEVLDQGYTYAGKSAIAMLIQDLAAGS